MSLCGLPMLLKKSQSITLSFSLVHSVLTPSGGFSGFDLRPEAVRNFVAYSLTRLNVEVIDIYEPGRILPNIPIEDVVGAIANLIKEGKVKYIGLSEANAEQLRKANAVHPVTVVEVEYSLATRVIEKKLL